MSLGRAVLVSLFIGSLVVANLLVAWLGPWALPVTAFFMIGLDLTVRDALHEAWHGRGLVWRMAVLIGAGAVIAYLLNRDAFWVGVASFSAFSLAGASDVLVYEKMFDRPWMEKVNASNAVAGLVDSLAFTLIAFHEWLPWVVLTQWMIKAGGGFFWSLVLRRLRDRYPVLKGV